MCFCVDGCKIDVGFQNFDYPCLLIFEKEQFLGPNLRERVEEGFGLLFSYKKGEKSEEQSESV
jgi:hypothetical protein